MAIAVVCLIAAGCAFGPRSLEHTRLRYNEAIKATTEEQLLLNIVRLRYVDNPSSLAISVIATQFEGQGGIQLLPFFAIGPDADPRRFSAILPGVQAQLADRPTTTLTPLDDQEFTRRLFTPLPLEGVLYLAKTTWPIATVFRLYLENLNWVSNAQTGSGPTPKRPPEYAEYLRGITALQALQDRGQIVFIQEERTEKLGGALPAERIMAAAIIEAAKNGHEYIVDEKDGTWTLTKKTLQPVLRIHPQAVDSDDMAEFARVFRLKRGLDRYDLKVESLDPFSANYPPEGVMTIDLETRSLLQVLFFVSQGVEVPPEHRTKNLVRVTRSETGEAFDWQHVHRDLFKVNWAHGQKPPNGRVAIRYRGYWFYIDETDHDTLSTFALLVEASRLELAARGGSGPVLTLPISGR